MGLRVYPFCLQDVTDTFEVGKRVFSEVWTVRRIDALNCVLYVNFIFDVTPIRIYGSVTTSLMNAIVANTEHLYERIDILEVSVYFLFICLFILLRLSLCFSFVVAVFFYSLFL